MKWVVSLALLVSLSAYADCFEMVEVGEQAATVIEKCGEPQRRDSKEVHGKRTVEVVRGDTVGREAVARPLYVEKWYYDSSLNRATVIHLEDGGVSKKERLVRGE